VLERAGQAPVTWSSLPFAPALPRVVATDLDGTLLRSDGTISARTARTVVALEEAGVDVVFVTARPPEWLEPLADAVGGHGAVICANGAFVYDVPSRSILSSHVLDPGLVAGLAAELRGTLPAAALAIQGPGGLLFESHFPLLWPPEPTWRSAPRVEEFLDVPVGKLMVQCARTPGDELVGRVEALLAGRAVVCHSGAPSLAEVSARGVTKAAALERWCTARGYASTDVWAFGDMPNDLPMLQWASRSFAVAGAHPEVLAAADHVVASNDDDGVAQVMDAALAAAHG